MSKITKQTTKKKFWTSLIFKAIKVCLIKQLRYV